MFVTDHAYMTSFWLLFLNEFYCLLTFCAFHSYCYIGFCFYAYMFISTWFTRTCCILMHFKNDLAYFMDITVEFLCLMLFWFFYVVFFDKFFSDYKKYRYSVNCITFGFENDGFLVFDSYSYKGLASFILADYID